MPCCRKASTAVVRYGEPPAVQPVTEEDQAMDESEQTAPEDGEPTSITAKAKRLYHRHKKKVRAGVGAAAAAAAGVAIKMALESYINKDAEANDPVVHDDSSSDFTEWEKEYRASEPDRRRPPSEHTVQGHPMRINGEASAEEKANWARAYEAGLVDTPEPPPGWTWRSDSVRGGTR